MTRAYTTLLFDLDGTLLDIHMPSFLKEYFSLLASRFGAGGDVGAFRDKMIGAVRAMLENRDETLLLSRLFLDFFSPQVGMSGSEVRDILRDFTLSEFEELRHLTRPFPGTRPLLEKARSMKLTLALATNPVFFREAIESRMRWAGIAHLPFRFVSTAENMHCCKPHREYFLEVLSHLGREPRECVMIGNDPLMDMAAGKAGLTTWFVHPAGEERMSGEADYSGTLDDLSLWLDEVRGPTSPRPGSS